MLDNPALPGVTKKDMWKGMVGFDRPTWFRWLNRKGTWFLTGQFFWHYLVDNPSCRAQESERTPQARARGGACLVGGLDLPSSVRGANVSFRDKIRDWESIFTLAASSFYRGGSVVPTLGMAVDPVNQWNMEAFWAVDYVVREDFIVNLAQRYFITPRGTNHSDFRELGDSRTRERSRGDVAAAHVPVLRLKRRGPPHVRLLAARMRACLGGGAAVLIVTTLWATVLRSTRRHGSMSRGALDSQPPG